MFRQGIITSIISKFDEFQIVLFKTAYAENSGWLQNPDKKMSYKELLELNSLEKLKTEIISKEVDALLRDSHYEQINFIDTKLKLGIQDDFHGWLTFLEITERRNLFVHTGGAISKQFIENCNRWKIKTPENLKEGVYLDADDAYISQAIDCSYEISVRLVQAAIRRLFPRSFDELDKLLNNKAVELLTLKRWDLAQRIFSYALQIPKDLRSRGEMGVLLPYQSLYCA